MTDEFDTLGDHDELSGYLDGELTAEERADVDGRLAASASLRSELAEVRAARDALRAVPARDAPEGFWDAVIAGVAAAGVAAADVDVDGTAPAPVVTMESRRSRRARAGWLAGAAAAAAAIVAVVVLPGRTSVRPNVAAVATQHAASSSDVGDSISSLAPVGPLVGRR